ncbi:MAG: hypothetical protein ABSG64_08895, partial [Solirubrobacteraceae bacterium]
MTSTLALFLALGGTAWAAHHYLITATSQISPGVRGALKGNGRTPWVRSAGCESFDDPVEWVEGAIACRDAGTRRSRLFAS